MEESKTHRAVAPVVSILSPKLVIQTQIHFQYAFFSCTPLGKMVIESGAVCRCDNLLQIADIIAYSKCGLRIVAAAISFLNFCGVAKLSGGFLIPNMQHKRVKRTLNNS
jgi:hypothetical protein